MPYRRRDKPVPQLRNRLLAHTNTRPYNRSPRSRRPRPSSPALDANRLGHLIGLFSVLFRDDDVFKPSASPLGRRAQQIAKISCCARLLRPTKLFLLCSTRPTTTAICAPKRLLPLRPAAVQTRHVGWGAWCSFSHDRYFIDKRRARIRRSRLVMSHFTRK